GDSLLVHFLARHVDCCQMHVHIFPCDGAPRAAARHEQNVCVSPVAADVCADYAVSAASMAQDCSTGTVAKKDATVAIGPVGDRRQFLGADHKDRLVCMGGNELLCNLQPKKKACTGCGNVEASGVGCSDLLLNKAGGGWEKHIRRGGCHDDEIDLFRGNFCLVECLERCLGRHIAR